MQVAAGPRQVAKIHHAIARQRDIERAWLERQLLCSGHCRGNAVTGMQGAQSFCQ
jgi:hypothetical protein